MENITHYTPKTEKEADLSIIECCKTRIKIYEEGKSTLGLREGTIYGLKKIIKELEDKYLQNPTT